jgi:hypothetical protein
LPNATFEPPHLPHLDHHVGLLVDDVGVERITTAFFLAIFDACAKNSSLVSVSCVDSTFSNGLSSFFISDATVFFATGSGFLANHNPEKKLSVPDTVSDFFTILVVDSSSGFVFFLMMIGAFLVVASGFEKIDIEQQENSK